MEENKEKYLSGTFESQYKKINADKLKDEQFLKEIHDHWGEFDEFNGEIYIYGIDHNFQTKARNILENS